jgi:hypothetical protein
MDILAIIKQYLPFIAPLVLIQLVLVIYALVDLVKRQKTRGPRWLWAVLLIVSVVSFPGGVIAACLYLFWGRNVEAGNDRD